MTDINDRILRLIVWCLVISCLVGVGLGSSVNASAAGGYCRPLPAPNPMPKRATVIRRQSVMSPESVSGCVNNGLLHSGGDLVAVIHLIQPKKTENFAVNIRVSPPPEGFTGRLTLVLHSQFAMNWRVDLSELLHSDVAQRRHQLVLTHVEALTYAEQLHADRYMDVNYFETLKELLNAVELESDVNYENRKKLEEEMKRLGIEKPTFMVSMEAQEWSGRMEIRLVNAVDVRLPSRIPSNESSPDSGCQIADFETLDQLVGASLDSFPEAGFTSCRSQSWESDGKIRPLLQLVQFSPEFQTNPDFKMEVRLKAPPISKPGAAQRVVVAFLFDKPFILQLDTRSVRREITVLSNVHLSLAYPGYQNSKLVNITVVDTRGENEFMDLLLGQLEGGAANWSVERLTLKESMELLLEKLNPTLLDLRLHEAPLLLRDMEPWVRFTCFVTKDLVVVVPRRIFDALGVDKSQVLLGGDPKCTMYENSTSWWVWRVLLRRTNTNSCSTTSKNFGSHTTVYGWLSVNTSTTMEVYRLFISCMFRDNRVADHPPEDKQSDPSFLWGKDTNGSRIGESLSKTPVAEDFSLELFLDDNMSQSLSTSQVTLKTNQRLYGRIQSAQASVEAGLMVRDCVITGARDSYGSNSHKHYILHHGCEMGAYFSWVEGDSYRIKSFSFELPRLSFFSQDSTFFLNCLIQPCNYFHQNPNLPRCWNQRVICYFPSMPAPLKLVAGPFSSFSVATKETGREEEIRIPLWGVVLIAGFAFVFGVAGAGVLWLVHHLTRRRGRRRRRSQLSPDCPPASVLLRMNARHLEQERRRLIHVGVTRPEFLWGHEAFRG